MGYNPFVCILMVRVGLAVDSAADLHPGRRLSRRGPFVGVAADVLEMVSQFLRIPLAWIPWHSFSGVLPGLTAGGLTSRSCDLA